MKNIATYNGGQGQIQGSDDPAAVIVVVVGVVVAVENPTPNPFLMGMQQHENVKRIVRLRVPLIRVWIDISAWLFIVTLVHFSCASRYTSSDIHFGPPKYFRQEHLVKM